jgi:hypothetical protein
MGRTLTRVWPDRERVLVPARRLCPACGGVMRIRYENHRTSVTLSGPVRLRLKIRRCEHEGCARHRVAYRPEAGARWPCRSINLGWVWWHWWECCVTGITGACRRSMCFYRGAAW